jgi:glutamate-1-semialdehyde 2,1-aminomutase
MNAEMKWTKSREMFQRAQKSLLGGVSSPFRAKAAVPLYIAGGEGSRIRDVDGNSYIDYALAWGPLILGHSHPRLCEAVAKRAKVSHTFGAQHEDEYLVAERIQELVPCAERVAYTSSGTEAVQFVLRLARAATGRSRILKFEGHYHGWVDSISISYHPGAAEGGPHDSPRPVLTSRGQTPNSADNLVISVWNSVTALEDAFRAYPGEIAAVITEPVLCNSGCLTPLPEYLEKIREITEQNGALLIFDEVITGFRQSLGGAQEYYGVIPDLATFGKAIAGGAALSAVVGSKEIMEQAVNGGVAFGGTFNGNPLALAAAGATLKELAADDGACLLQANQLGRQLMSIFRTAAQKHEIPLAVCGFGAAFAIHFTERERLIEYRDTLEDDLDKLRRFVYRMLEEGILTLPDGRFYVSVVHTEDDIAMTAEAIDRIFGEQALKESSRKK